jgi:hypothetical protein
MEILTQFDYAHFQNALFGILRHITLYVHILQL